MYKIILPIFLSLITITSCTQNDINDCESYSIGDNTQIATESFDYMSYNPNDTIVFQNSQGTSITFVPKIDTLYNTTNQYRLPCDPNKSVSMGVQIKRLVFESSNYLLTLSITAQPALGYGDLETYLQNPIYYDLVSASVHYKTTSGSTDFSNNTYIFTISSTRGNSLNDLTYVSSNLSTLSPSYTVGGQTYTDVYSQASNTGLLNDIKYNKAFGVLSFKDNNTQWRFAYKY